jgi:ketosteroid isomerase-like protein
MESNAAEMARRLVRAFGNPGAIADLLTEDIEWWITPTVGVLGSPTVGRQAVLAAMRVIFGELYGDVSVTVHHAIGEGDLGAVRITLDAEAKVAGGRPVQNEYSVWIRRRGALIDRVWEYLDVAWATAQLQRD